MIRLHLTRVQLLVFVLGMAATAVIVAVIVAALSSAVNTSKIRDTQVDNTAKNDERDATLVAVKRLTKKINSCVQPKGECNKRGAENTAQAVGDIGRYVVLAAACAADMSPDLPVDQRVAAITDCVMKRLSR